MIERLNKLISKEKTEMVIKVFSLTQLLLLFIWTPCIAQINARVNCGILSIEQLKDSCKHITEIELKSDHSMKISKLPLVVFDLKNLKELRLIDTKISELPCDLERLTELKSLYIDGSKIKAIPSCIARLDSLASLVVYNSLVTTLPKEIQNMPHLTSLGISGKCRINFDSVFNVIEKSNIKELMIGYKKLKFLPESIKKLNRVEYIRIIGSSKVDVGSLISQLNTMGSIKRIEFFNCDIKSEMVMELVKIKANIDIYFSGRNIAHNDLLLLHDKLGGNNNIYLHGRIIKR